MGGSRWTRGKGPWTLVWQSAEMNLSSARKLELLLKRQKGGDGFRSEVHTSELRSSVHPLGRLLSEPDPATNLFQIAVAYRVYVIHFCDGELSTAVIYTLSLHDALPILGGSRWTRGKGPWTLVWQSAEMNLSSARKLELLLKRQKGGDGFYRMVGLSRVSS